MSADSFDSRIFGDVPKSSCEGIVIATFSFSKSFVLLEDN